ncbi:MAG: adenosylmethionine decarboxylase [Pseudomonadota bacterium]
MPRAAVQLGVDANPTIDTQTDFSSKVANRDRPVSTGLAENGKDYFIEREGVRYAGTHMIVDLWGARRLDDLEHIERTLRDCVNAAGATLLHIHLHHFTPNHGVSGVAVLAESHISVHTWPENGFAAFDVFMCGDARPDRAVDVLRQAFDAERVEVGEHLRGRME